MTHWLRDNHWRFVVDKNGLPKVARVYLDQKLGLSVEPKAAKFDASPTRQAFV